MKLSRMVAGLVAATVISFATSAAQASTYQFTLTGDYSATWELPSTLSPGQFNALDGVFFYLFGVDGTFQGIDGPANLEFYNDSVHGGLDIAGAVIAPTLLSTTGAQLYTGTETDTVTFNLGTFVLDDFYATGKTYSLTVTDLSAAPVPEPGSMGMLLGGLGLVGAASARRRNGRVTTA